ncbi:MAG: ROK family protein [Chloroflexi bacterium]|nr:ROK family protein [Chloroflexota bacterium]MDA8218397.1 ROK family protein [Dehalococcoidales bacterium]
MAGHDPWAIGVDLGGTKVEVAHVDLAGQIRRRLRRPTDVKDGPAAVEAEIVAAVSELREAGGAPPIAVGVGVAGQIEAASGVVRYAPNLGWHDVPLQADLQQALGLPIAVTNDVRAATWGEWLHGAGQGCDDLVCLFVGTGIGGGVVSGGRMLIGGSNTAGELGHMTIDLHGSSCHCGNRGCLEALAGGWAIARRAQEAIGADRSAGASLLRLADGRQDAVTARIVAEAAHAGDPLARELVEEVAQALIAGAIGIVNGFNPSRLVLGGGVIEGQPELVARVARGVSEQALEAASTALQVLPARLHNDAGVVGAAALAMRLLAKEGGQ